ncbi:hypothetical protein [Marinitenerispora sediminis]|uniref:Uncharacterized protein n=1 Tax=Marinitenerispora sediminis TaxID=1931232 RepID=A0A368T7K9_9ACTN|nr:hypothetical protein [Marinitenerispora sediminis]RCV54643.1 hypothetical protein DEF23_15500 [Marinitenerispora sediminis]RCV56399.1 hypothetical protein DEF28_03575 [Marinitenerispora sediminis]RCV59743.1 hypothetical protein DEF24_08900 [Marinitenerispora sediminis]
MTDEELDRLLTRTDRALLHAWHAEFARMPRPAPPGAGPAEPVLPAETVEIDLVATGQFHSYLVSLLAITDLLVEVTAHLGREGRMVTSQVRGHLDRLRAGLDTRTLRRDDALDLIADIRSAERRLRAMMLWEFAPSTCRCTYTALDNLSDAIANLRRQVHALFGDSDTRDLAQR